MEKHTNIPEGATWNSTYNQWELGEKNAAGKAIGTWEEWHVDGHLCGRVDYGDGVPPFITNRFHPDGTLAEEGNWYGGQKWLGTLRFIKCDKPTSEVFPTGDAARNPIVWIAEFDYIDEGVYNAQRYYDRQNRPVSARGTPLPKRPASVPERAYYVDQGASIYFVAHWVLGEIDIRKNTFIGEVIMWDLNGNLLAKQLFDRSSDELEQHEYFNGKLSHSKLYVGDDLFENYYYLHIHPPVVKKSIASRNNDKDCEQTFFDETGRRLYSVRDEKVTDLHQRKYYNDILVYECIQHRDDIMAPVHLQYFYPGGATLIDYTSNGDDTGTFRMYDEAGGELLTMLQGDEAFINKNNRWNYFVPQFTTDPEYTTITAYWDAIAQNFRKEYELNVINKKIKALPVPEQLKVELDKVDWGNINTTTRGGGNDLPVAINGMLSEDEDVAAESTNRIWFQIECEGALFESTFRVGIILTRMLPFYIQVPVVRQHLAKFLFNVVAQPYIRVEPDRYEELMASFESLLPLLFQWAIDADPLIARQAQCILIHAGTDLPETEALLIKEWSNTTYPGVRRGYAVFALGSLYAFKGQAEKMISEFTPAFLTETDALVRLLLAIYLVVGAKEDAQECWLAELFTALTDATAVRDDFDSMQPFRGDSDIQEYILKVLYDMTPAILEKIIEPLIATLPATSRPKQEPLFQAICTVLLGDGHVLDDMEPLTQKVLLAIADVVEKDPGFVNHHGDWLWNYSVPQHATMIRDLAGKMKMNGMPVVNGSSDYLNNNPK